MQITAIEKDKRRMKTINKAAISITVIAAMTMCMSFAYAGIFESIGDALFVGTALTNPTDIIIGGVIMLVFKVIAQLIASLLDSFLSPVYTITTMKLGDLYKYIPITNKTYADAGAIWADDLGPTVNRVLLGTGLMIWVVLSIFAILIDFYYVASGDKRAVPGSKLFLKIVVTGVLTWKSQELMFYIFDNIIQPLTSSFQDAVKGADSTPNVFSVIGSSFCTISAGLVGAVIAIIEKPESLKTAAEIKQEEKDAKKAAKLEKKKQKEYLSTLGPKERKIAKARFKAQALEKAERDRKRREEELRIYNEAIAKREKEEAEKAKEEQTLSQLEKDKENNKKLSARQAAAQRRAEIKKLRRENTLREKEEAKAAKKKAKEDALAKKQAEKEAKKKTSPKKKQVAQNKAGVAAAPSVQQKEQPKKPLLINLDKVSKKEKQQATQQTAAPAVQEQKSQKSAIDNILKKETKKKEEPAKEEKQAESKTEVIKPEKKEPAIVPVVKASSVQEQTTEKPTHQPVNAPQKEEVTVTDSKKADVREVPDLLDSHNVFYGIGANQGNEFVLDDDEKGGNSL